MEVPDWNHVFRDPTLPLMVDIGSGTGRCFAVPSHMSFVCLQSKFFFIMSALALHICCGCLIEPVISFEL